MGTKAPREPAPSSHSPLSENLVVSESVDAGCVNRPRFISYQREDNKPAYPHVVDRLVKQLNAQISPAPTWSSRPSPVSTASSPGRTGGNASATNLRAWPSSSPSSPGTGSEARSAARSSDSSWPRPESEWRAAVRPLVPGGHDLLSSRSGQDEVRIIEALNCRDIEAAFLTGSSPNDARPQSSGGHQLLAPAVHHRRDVTTGGKSAPPAAIRQAGHGGFSRAAQARLIHSRNQRKNQTHPQDHDGV